MNEYVQDLEQRAPALFRGGTAEYCGEYLPAEEERSWGTNVPIRVREAGVLYTVSNQESAGHTEATISVPLHDVADFEPALNQRIQEGAR